MDRSLSFVLGFGPALLLGGLFSVALAAKRSGSPSAALFVCVVAVLVFVLPIPGLTAANDFGSVPAIAGGAVAFLAGYSLPRELVSGVTFPIGFSLLLVLAGVIDAGRRDGLTILYLPALLTLAWVVLPILALSGGKPMKVFAVASAILPIVLGLLAGRR